MPSSLVSHELDRPGPAKSAPRNRRSSGAKWPADTRMLAQQQARLLAGTARLLSRLVRGLLWPQMRPADRRRVLTFLSRLEHDLELTRLITRTPPPAGADAVPDPGDADVAEGWRKRRSGRSRNVRKPARAARRRHGQAALP